MTEYLNFLKYFKNFDKKYFEYSCENCVHKIIDFFKNNNIIVEEIIGCLHLITVLIRKSSKTKQNKTKQNKSFYATVYCFIFQTVFWNLIVCEH